MRGVQISMEKLFPSGAWECSAIAFGRLVRMRYEGYTKREARAEFADHLRTLAKFEF